MHRMLARSTKRIGRSNFYIDLFDMFGGEEPLHVSLLGWL